MKNIFCLIIFCGMYYSGITQTKKIDLATLQKVIWGNLSEASQETSVPDQWSGESAVILYREIDFFYSVSRRIVFLHNYVRKRIKLLDKSAVKQYSEFSFSKNSKLEKGFWAEKSEVFAAFKVIKPDGSEHIVDVNSTLEVNTDEGEKINKVAIPDLEEGDIIDYFYYVFEQTQTEGVYYFDPTVSTLSDEHHIVKQNISLHLQSHYYHINFKSFNGAPSIKAFSDGSKFFKARPKKKFYQILSYELTDEMREKKREISWLYEMRVLPFIKFSVLYNEYNRSDPREGAFMDDPGEVKQTVDMDDIGIQLGQVLASKYPNMIIFLVKHLKKKGLYQVPGKEKEMINEIYYYQRYWYFSYRVESERYEREGYKINFGVPIDFSYNHWRFVYDFATILRKFEIDFNILASCPRAYGELGDILFPSEISYIFRINLDEPYYLAPFDQHSLPGTVPYERG